METDFSVVSYEFESVRTSKKDETFVDYFSRQDKHFIPYNLRSLLFTEKIKMNGSGSLVHTRSIEINYNFHPFPVNIYYSVIKKMVNGKMEKIIDTNLNSDEAKNYFLEDWNTSKIYKFDKIEFKDWPRHG